MKTIQEKIDIIFRDVYDRGHGRKTTIQRIIDVLGYSKSIAEKIVDKEIQRRRNEKNV